MDAGTISTVVLAVVGLLGVVGAIFGWVYRRAGSEHVTAVAIADNTAATRELTGELRDFKDHTVAALHDHDKRLTILEKQVN